MVPAGWAGQLPPGVERIETPTPMVWIIGRVKTDGPADYDAVHQVQDALRITPLSSWGKQPPPVPVVIDPSVDMTTPPLDQVNAMSGTEFFRHGAELMKVHRPHLTDWSALARLRRIGIEVGESFDADALDPAARQALDTVPGDAQKVLLGRLPALVRVVNGTESLDHLRPWLPWAAGYTKESAAEFLAMSAQGWADGTEFGYAILAGGALAGGCGLMSRIGPGGLEIGYWVHRDWTRRGLATAASAALVEAAFRLPGVDRVEIVHDELNVASAGRPPQAGLHRGRPAPPGPAPARRHGIGVVWRLVR